MYFQKSSAWIVGNMVSDRTVDFSFAALYCTNFAKDPAGASFLSLRSTLIEESVVDKLGRLGGGSSCAAKEFRRAIPLRFNVGRFCAGAAAATGLLIVSSEAGFATLLLLLLLLLLLVAVLEGFVDAVREVADDAFVLGMAPVFWRRPIRVEGLAGGARLFGGGDGGGGGACFLSSPNTPGLSFAANFFCRSIISRSLVDCPLFLDDMILELTFTVSK